jgi:hypothetical protein
MATLNKKLDFNFEQIAILHFRADLKGPCFWRWNIYIHWALTYDGLLNTKYEWNSSNTQVPARRTSICTYRFTERRQTSDIPKMTFFCVFMGFKICKFVKISRVIFSTIKLLSHILVCCVYEKAKLWVEHNLFCLYLIWFIILSKIWSVEVARPLFSNSGSFL